MTRSERARFGRWGTGESSPDPARLSLKGSHIDTAWLWRYTQTQQKVSIRAADSALMLMIDRAKLVDAVRPD